MRELTWMDRIYRIREKEFILSIHVLIPPLNGRASTHLASKIPIDHNGIGAELT